MIEIKKILVLDQAFMDSLTKKSTLLTRVGPVPVQTPLVASLETNLNQHTAHIF